MNTMNYLSLILVIFACLTMHSVLGYYEAGCRLEHETADKFFNCTIYQSNNVTSGEYSMRIDVCYDDNGVNSICESIIQRFDRLLAANYRSSSQLIIGEPWTPWRRCCQHDALGTTPQPTLTPAVGETHTILRSDNFTRVRITSVNFNPTIDINAAILRNYDNAEAVCDLKCAATVDAVFNLDNSSSISASQFLIMVEFIRSFIDAFTISLTKTNLGIILFSGVVSATHDRYFIVNTAADTRGAFTNSAEAETFFMDTALVDNNWADKIDWTNGSFVFSSYTGWQVNASENSDRAGVAFLELYMTPFKYLIEHVLTKFGNGEARHGIGYEYTSMGTGILLARHVFFRNGNRPSPVDGSNGFPRLLLSLTDGENNRGTEVADAAAVARLIPNVTLIGMGIGPGPKVSEVEAASSPPVADNSYYVTSFDEAQFNAILTPLISGSCLGQSDNAIPCGSSCSAANGMCTACGDCIQCTTNDDCPSCGICSTSPFGSCVVDEDLAISSCSAPTPCTSIICDSTKPRSEMCVVNFNDTAKIEAVRVQCVGEDGSKPFTFDQDSCLCTADPASGDGGVSGAAIAGGAIAGAAAILLLLALLAALLLLLLLAALFIIIAVIVAAIVMLAFGVTMAIPPSITALEVTAPNQVVNEENPLAVDQMEWVESAAQDA